MTSFILHSLIALRFRFVLGSLVLPIVLCHFYWVGRVLCRICFSIINSSAYFICIQPPRSDIVSAELTYSLPQLITCTRFAIHFSFVLVDDVNELTSDLLALVYKSH